MNTKAAKQESNLAKFMKAPFRIIRRAGDFYVRVLTDCSGKMNTGSALGPVYVLPKSFSTSSSRSNDEEDIRELIRAASRRGGLEKLQMEIQKQRQSSKKLPRSFTVGIGRIDEETTCEFEEDFKVKPELLYPRSKSHAVVKRTTYAL